MKVQMFQMYCGESILVSNDDSCLLIDCGSHSSDISLFDNVINTLCHFRHKEAMITHFHDDHFNGFMYITDPVRTRVVSFDNVYIPHIFTVGLHYNVIGYNFLARHNVHKNLIIILKHPYTVKIYINLLLTFSILVLNCFVN